MSSPNLPRVIGDILIGLGLILFGVVVFAIVANAPSTVLVAFAVMIVAWVIGWFVRDAYQFIRADETSGRIPPPPSEE